MWPVELRPVPDVKDQDLRRVCGLTWAGWLNVFLQFTGFRLRRVVESDGTISAWQIRWSPIWRTGWSLPTRTPLPPGHSTGPNSVFAVSAERGVVTVRVTDPASALYCDFVVDRSFELRSDIHCRSLSFGPKPRRRWFRPKPLTLTLAGYLLTVDSGLHVPAWGRVQSHRPPTLWQRLRAVFRRPFVTTTIDETPGISRAAFGPCTVVMRVSEPVAAGDLVAIDENGDARPARRAYRTGSVGTFLTGAPSGGTASVRIGDEEDAE